jgi:hypothetical protein
MLDDDTAHAMPVMRFRPTLVAISVAITFAATEVLDRCFKRGIIGWLTRTMPPESAEYILIGSSTGLCIVILCIVTVLSSDPREAHLGQIHGLLAAFLSGQAMLVALVGGRITNLCPSLDCSALGVITIVGNFGVLLHAYVLGASLITLPLISAVIFVIHHRAGGDSSTPARSKRRPIRAPSRRVHLLSMVLIACMAASFIVTLSADWLFKNDLTYPAVSDQADRSTTPLPRRPAYSIDAPRACSLITFRFAAESTRDLDTQEELGATAAAADDPGLAAIGRYEYQVETSGSVRRSPRSLDALLWYCGIYQ